MKPASKSSDQSDELKNSPLALVKRVLDYYFWHGSRLFECALNDTYAPVWHPEMSSYKYDRRGDSLGYLQDAESLLLRCAKEFSAFVKNREALVAAQRKHPKGLLALPDEILSEVMILATIKKFEENSVRTIQDVFALPRVCSRFRHIVYGTPRVWSYIDSHHSYTQTQRLLELSKASPLELQLQYFTVMDPSDPALVVLKQLLIPQMHRVCSLSITFYEKSQVDDVNPVIGIPVLDLSSIRHLSIAGRRTGQWLLSGCTLPSPWCLRIEDAEFKVLKCLVGPTLTACEVVISDAARQLPGADVESNSLQGLLGALAQAPALQDLLVSIHPKDLPNTTLPLEAWSPACRVTFPNLEHLRFEIMWSFDEVGDTHLLLLYMDMPKIRALYAGFIRRSPWESDYDEGPRDRVYVGGPINGPVGFLESFYVGGVRYPFLEVLAIHYEGRYGQILLDRGQNPLPNIFTSMPCLKHITLTGEELDPLGKGYAEDDLKLWEALPSLKTIRLVNQRLERAYVQTFLKMYQKTHRNGQLNKLEICDPLGNSTNEGLEEVRGDALVIIRHWYN